MVEPNDLPSPFDPDRLRVAFEVPAAQAAASPKRRAPRIERSEDFLGGRPPLSALAAAGRLPGRTLHVALVLWFIAGVESRRAALALRPSVLKCFGVDRHAAYRALAQLEAAGLVTVRRARGRAPVVTLLDAPAFGTISRTDEGSQ